MAGTFCRMARGSSTEFARKSVAPPPVVPKIIREKSTMFQIIAVKLLFVVISVNLIISLPLSASEELKSKSDDILKRHLLGSFGASNSAINPHNIFGITKWVEPIRIKVFGDPGASYRELLNVIIDRYRKSSNYMIDIEFGENTNVYYLLANNNVPRIIRRYGKFLKPFARNNTEISNLAEDFIRKNQLCELKVMYGRKGEIKAVLIVVDTSEKSVRPTQCLFAMSANMLGFSGAKLEDFPVEVAGGYIDVSKLPPKDIIRSINVLYSENVHIGDRNIITIKNH